MLALHAGLLLCAMLHVPGGRVGTPPPTAPCLVAFDGATTSPREILLPRPGPAARRDHTPGVPLVSSVKDAEAAVRPGPIPGVSAAARLRGRDLDPLAALLSGAGYACLPLERLGHHVVVNARVSGSPVRLVVDTGSQDTYLDPERTAGLELRWRLAEEYQPDPDGKLYQGCHLSELELGEVKVPRLQVWAYNMTSFNDLVSDASDDDLVDGILGNDVLRKYRAIIDLASDRLYLRRPGASGRPDGRFPELRPALERAGYQSDALKWRPDWGTPQVTVTVNGFRFRLVLDTGSDCSCLDRKRTAILDLDWSRQGDGGRVDRGAFTVYYWITAKVPPMEVGGIEVPSFKVSAIDFSPTNRDLEESQPGSGIDGLLGGRTLAKHRAVIDYGSERLYMKPGRR